MPPPPGDCYAIPFATERTKLMVVTSVQSPFHPPNGAALIGRLILALLDLARFNHREGYP